MSNVKMTDNELLVVESVELLPRNPWGWTGRRAEGTTAMNVHDKAEEKSQEQGSSTGPTTPQPSRSQSKESKPILSSNPLLGPKWGTTQTAEAIGICATKLREFVKAGLIPTIQIEGKCLFFESDVAKFVAERYGLVSSAPLPIPQRASIPFDVLNSPYLKRGKRV